MPNIVFVAIFCDADFTATLLSRFSTWHTHTNNENTIHHSTQLPYLSSLPFFFFKPIKKKPSDMIGVEWQCRVLCAVIIRAVPAPGKAHGNLRISSLTWAYEAISSLLQLLLLSPYLSNQVLQSHSPKPGFAWSRDLSLCTKDWLSLRYVLLNIVVYSFYQCLSIWSHCI